MSDLADERCAHLRSILKPPYDDHPKAGFPVFATDKPFDLADYASESANADVD